MSIAAKAGTRKGEAGIVNRLQFYPPARGSPEMAFFRFSAKNAE